MGKYINPFTDWGFKRLFGQEFSKDLLISFFITNQREKEKAKLKIPLYDLVPVYVICFMNFPPRTEDEVKKFKTDVMLREKNSEQPFTDKLRFIYLSLPLFDKKAEECDTDFEKWIYVLKHMATLERIPFATQKKIFKRLADIADSRCLSKEEMEKYEESQRVVDNYNLGMYSAWYQGNKEGLVKGEKRGEKRGFLKGQHETQLTTAKNLLAMNLTPEQVSQGTKLPLEEVLALIKNS